MLDLNDLASGLIPAVRQVVGAMLAEAAGVCLESQGHTQGVNLTVSGYGNNYHTLVWSSIPRQQIIDVWGDAEYTTEHGAAGIAILLAKKEIGYEVVRRSRKGTGFDYWLGDESDEPFQDKARLEVSGIRNGDAGILNSRVSQKLRQVTRSDNLELSAYVIVVEFGQPTARIVKA